MSNDIYCISDGGYRHFFVRINFLLYFHCYCIVILLSVPQISLAFTATRLCEKKIASNLPGHHPTENSKYMCFVSQGVTKFL